MTPATCYRFDAFDLDIGNRRLVRDGAAVALNARYLDALALLVREHGRLVGKQRFFDEVWAGSVVTDAALTQCIKEIRRLLGDDASNPRFVRTVPGHGYSFIAPVSEYEDHARDASHGAPPPTAPVAPATTAATPAPDDGGRPSATAAAAAVSHGPAGRSVAVQEMPAALSQWLTDVAAAIAGGAAAGLVGGLLYGSALTVAPQSAGLGTLSVLLVLLALSVLVGMAGALGVGAGLASGRLLGGQPGWMLAGAALGGLLVGGLVKLLGSDAFSLLVGHAPDGITGGLEGAAIGLALAVGLLLGGGPDAVRARRPAAMAAATTALAGALIPLAGGSMMATSLVRVAATFDQSRLDMAPLGRLFGEPQFGPLAQAALGALEGGVFGACVVATLVLAGRYRNRGGQRSA